jgi:hypothetical protein
MVLRKADQEQALLSELEYFRQKGSNTSTVVRLNGPTPPRASNHRVTRSLFSPARYPRCFHCIGPSAKIAGGPGDVKGSVSCSTMQSSA